MSGLRLVKVSQKKLFKIAAKPGSVRVGSTRDYHQRAGSYQTPSGGGYTGKFYVAKTDNMMKTEDRVLATSRNAGRGRHNHHGVSNAKKKPGHVYVIKGQKRCK